MELFSRFLLSTLAAILLLSSGTSMAAANTQRLACFYYDTAFPSEGVGRFSPTFPSVWAQGVDDEEIYVSGTMRDGFFAIEKVKGKIRGYFNKHIIQRYDNDDELAHEFCLRGLHAMFPERVSEFQILHFGVKQSFLSSKYFPVVFEKHRNPHVSKIDKLVIFGDSLSDQGNLKRFIKFFPNEPYFAGRFSNSWIWVDYFKKMNDLSVQNWAIGGSLSDDNRVPNTGTETLSERLRVRARAFASGSVRSEINRYRKTSLNNGEITDGASTFFVLWAGGNDYIYSLERPVDTDTFLDTPSDPRIGSDVVMARVINNVMSHAQVLYSLGARNFLIGNMPDLGKTPLMLENVTYHTQTGESDSQRIFLLSSKMSAITRMHNIRLQNAVDNFQKQHPDVTIALVDVAQGSDNMVNSINFEDGETPFDYDIDQTLRQEVSYGTQSVVINRSCYTGRSYLTDESLACAEPNRTLFWDGVHPSSYAHCMIAAFFHQTAAQLGTLMPASMQTYMSHCRPDLIVGQ